MENDNMIEPEQSSAEDKKNQQTNINEDGTEFENPDVDPGFDIPEDNKLTSREDKRTGDIDSRKSVSEMREEFEKKQNDSSNLNNDR
jgi:hypothetical protein